MTPQLLIPADVQHTAESIGGLHADIVPHRRWAMRKWYYASNLWYYHRPGITGEIKANRKFYQLVDDDLRALCRLLHESAIRTTPSCQGHFYGPQRFQTIWEQLKREEQLIRTQRLPVKDCETDAAFIFHDSKYECPWPSFESFYAQAAMHQNQGYVGLIVPFNRPGLTNALQKDAYATQRAEISLDKQIGGTLGGWLFHAFVRPRNIEERAREWQAITRYMQRLLTSTNR